MQGSKKESRGQTKKETEGERESRGYAKKDRGERQKAEVRKRKRLKRIGSENTKIKKYMFHLENRQQQRKEGRKRWK